ncbi:sugar phosphate isomerase/epimerase family protein [Actomonas aquatica]|uniref:Sugar phosphate isomerase/epimerase family protein n=1 Tax=Actomonas aquatica TaxID=2866162 RepID=A0ABZ1CD64_9BACT|nr:sugar phosphate isomerase/epimerase family protein [Opitutus sp. WL0086]WRQ88245.1 sugar phosphate isomerase/epimerase family protein [Opitutus sp. WL0086]
MNLTRRYFLTTSATALAAAALAPRLLAAPSALPRFPVAVCDWMILKRQKLGAFKRTSEIGADGLELDMGGLGDRPTFDNKLLDPAAREQFLAEAAKYDLRLSSIAMSGFYAQSFAERDGIERVVEDTITTTVAMGVRTIFLPLGVRSDLVAHPELRPAVVARLKAAGQRAADAGVVIGIESAYDAAGELALLQDIDSPAVKSYFNFANALQNDRDLHAELRTLGAANICQIHASNKDVHWLENDPQIDLPAVKATLDDMGWHGWLVIERSRDASNTRDVVGNYGANTRYLKKVFQS